MCNKIDGFSKVYNKTRHLVLFCPERCNAIYDWIKYLLSKKRCIT